MTAHKYFLDGFGSEEELSKLTSLPVFPLVREMHFKYGLLVVKELKAYPNEIGYQMCYPNGIAVGKVWTSVDENRIVFNYRSPFYAKERGGDRRDKETLRSVKISSLMATLTRQKVIPPEKEMISRKVGNLKVGYRTLQKHMGNSVKQNNFTTSEIHAMFATVLGVSPNSIGLSLDLNKCKKELDIYNEADRIQKVKAEEAKRLFLNPFYMVGIDEHNHYLIAKMKMIRLDSEHASEYETIEPFKRYKTIAEYPELIPLMTMVKVAYENKEGNKIGADRFPVRDVYDEGLDAVFFYNSSPTHYDHVWMATPCPI